MNNRWAVLVAGCLIQTILGGIYAWSTFVPYLLKDYKVSIGKCGFIFGLTILTFTTAMIFAGRVLVKKGPRFTAIISAVLFMAGYLLASFSEGSVPMLFLSLGIVTGCGIGFGYVCPLSVGMKWFPDQKGLVTGVAVAGFGAGAVVLSSLAEHFLLAGVDVLIFFRWLSICSGIILFAAALVLSEPPGNKQETSVSHDTSAMLTWPFSLSAIGLFAGTFAGLLIIGNLTPIGLEAGLTEKQAAVSVSLFAIGNGAGRITWGRLFDHIGYKCIPLSQLCFALVTILLLFSPSAWFIMLTVSALGFCFGANFVIYASAVSRYFGTDSFPCLYPFCFMAYGIAGVIGPGLGGYLADTTGKYNSSIYICIGLVACASVLSFFKLHVYNVPNKSQQELLNAT